MPFGNTHGAGFPIQAVANRHSAHTAAYMMSFGLQDRVGPVLVLEKIGSTEAGEAGTDDDNVRSLSGLRLACSNHRIDGLDRAARASSHDYLAAGQIGAVVLARHYF